MKKIGFVLALSVAALFAVTNTSQAQFRVSAGGCGLGGCGTASFGIQQSAGFAVVQQQPVFLQSQAFAVQPSFGVLGINSGFVGGNGLFLGGRGLRLGGRGFGLGLGVGIGGREFRGAGTGLHLRRRR